MSDRLWRYGLLRLLQVPTVSVFGSDHRTVHADRVLPIRCHVSEGEKLGSPAVLVIVREPNRSNSRIGTGADRLSDGSASRGSKRQ